MWRRFLNYLENYLFSSMCVPRTLELWLPNDIWYDTIYDIIMMYDTIYI
jgi:hypothetical protein